MKKVIITAGAYGARNSAGRVCPVFRGEYVSVPNDEAARLVRLGIAEIASEAPSAPAVAPQNAAELDGMPQDTPGEEEPPEGATNGEGGNQDNVDVSRLERMPKADLEQMAQDMGIDISGAKNNRERAELIAAAEETYGELPELEDGDIVK